MRSDALWTFLVLISLGCIASVAVIELTFSSPNVLREPRIQLIPQRPVYQRIDILTQKKELNQLHDGSPLDIAEIIQDSDAISHQNPIKVEVALEHNIEEQELIPNNTEAIPEVISPYQASPGPRELAFFESGVRPFRLSTEGHPLPPRCKANGKIITSAFVLGERTSGSTFTTNLMALNFKMPKSTEANEAFGWKHGVQRKVSRRPVSTKELAKHTESTMVIMVVRDALHWYSSFYRKPWHRVGWWDDARSVRKVSGNDSFSSWLREPWKQNIRESESHQNVIALRNYKNDYYRSLYATLPNACVVSHPWVGEHWDEFLQLMNSTMPLRDAPKKFEPITTHAGGIVWEDSPVEPLTKADIELIRAQQQPELELFFGLRPI